MTDTPTRAEVEALIAELRERKIVPPSRAPWHVQEVDVVCWKASIALTALLPLAYTETGETWKGYAESLGATFHFYREAAERRLAEVEAENTRLRKALAAVIAVADRETDIFRAAKAALSPQEAIGE